MRFAKYRRRISFDFAMATLTVVVFSTIVAGYRRISDSYAHVVASYVIRDLITITYRDKHRSVVQGTSRVGGQDKVIATNLCHFGLCPRVTAKMGITSFSRRK